MGLSLFLLRKDIDMGCSNEVKDLHGRADSVTIRLPEQLRYTRSHLQLVEGSDGSIGCLIRQIAMLLHQDPDVEIEYDAEGDKQELVIKTGLTWDMDQMLYPLDDEEDEDE